MELIWANCYRYNGTDHVVGQKAKSLAELFGEELVSGENADSAQRILTRHTLKGPEEKKSASEHKSCPKHFTEGHCQLLALGMKVFVSVPHSQVPLEGVVVHHTGTWSRAFCQEVGKDTKDCMWTLDRRTSFFIPEEAERIRLEKTEARERAAYNLSRRKQAAQAAERARSGTAVLDPEKVCPKGFVAGSPRDVTLGMKVFVTVDPHLPSVDGVVVHVRGHFARAYCQG